MKLLTLVGLLLTVGCTSTMIYTSDSYMNNVMDLCDGSVKRYRPRNGEVICAAPDKRSRE